MLVQRGVYWMVRALVTGVGARYPLWKIAAAHNAASDPRTSELTGVTIGPPMMIAASLRFT